MTYYGHRDAFLGLALGLPELRSQSISALINSRSEIISADQRCFTSDSALHITWNSLKSTDSALISDEKLIFQSSEINAEQRCFSIDFLWNISEQRWFFVDSAWHFSVQFSICFQIILKYFNFEARNFDFQPKWRKKGTTTFSSLIFWQAKDKK